MANIKELWNVDTKTHWKNVWSPGCDTWLLIALQILYGERLCSYSICSHLANTSNYKLYTLSMKVRGTHPSNL